MISIIIPTCNRVEDLKRCLASLVLQSESFDYDIEILVTDDGRKDSAEEMIREFFLEVQWLRGPCRGPAANRNAGVNTAKGEWLIFLDDDCLPQLGMLDAYIQAMNKGDASILEGATHGDRTFPSLLWEAPVNVNGNHLPSCNFAIRRDLYLKLKGFDERYFPSMEDMEFRARIIASEEAILFVPSASVVHPIRKVPGALKLAHRWETRVIQAFDQGASTFRVLWGLPWHALRVIQSRFRNQPFSLENLKASFRFFAEWVLVLCLTPGWVMKWRQRPRSPFWQKEVARKGPAPKYGF